MSFIIAVHVNEGIVLASDRRITVTDMKQVKNIFINNVGAYFSNSVDKTFICPSGVGISTCGDASIGGRPITGYIKDMIRTKMDKNTSIENIPQIILDYFEEFSPNLNTNFLIAGYIAEEHEKKQQIYRVEIKTKKTELVDTSGHGARWDGEINTITRLFQKVAVKQKDDMYLDLPFEDVTWNLFSLQDAVDFARYCVETTIQTMRFKKCVETVGGAVDILVITPDETRWLQKEELK